MVQLGKGLVEILTHFLALQCPACCQNRNFAEYIEDVNRDGLGTLLQGCKGRVMLHKVLDLVGDLRHVHTEVFHRQARLDKALLLHEHSIRHVVDHAFAEHRRRERRVRIFRRHLRQAAVEHEVRALGTEGHSHVAAKQCERKHVTVLLAALKEEAVWVHTIRHRRAHHRHPVEHSRGQRLALRYAHLVQHVQHNSSTIVPTVSTSTSCHIGMASKLASKEAMLVGC